MQWYVVHTKPNSEDLVYKHLAIKSVEAFLPKIQVIRKRQLTRLTLIEPLFPGYLFVRIELTPRNFNAVRWTPGVKRVLCYGEVPVPVPQEAIDIIAERIGEEGYIVPDLLAKFPPGTRVVVKRGPFEGLIGVVEKPMSRTGRVRVLLELMSKVTPVVVDVVDLQKVSW